jgi:hypothetical protein
MPCGQLFGNCLMKRKIRHNSYFWSTGSIVVARLILYKKGMCSYPWYNSWLQ